MIYIVLMCIGGITAFMCLLMTFSDRSGLWGVVLGLVMAISGYLGIMYQNGQKIWTPDFSVFSNKEETPQYKPNSNVSKKLGDSAIFK